MRRELSPSLPFACLLAATVFPGPAAYAILAGGEFDLPEDRPSWRADPQGGASPLNFVGALSITAGTSSYFGSAAALSPHWVLSAGHNVDFDDNGAVDSGLSVTFNLPGYGSYAASGFLTHPSFMGFGNPTIESDLSLLYFADPLPDSLFFPVLGVDLLIGDEVTLTGFGRSGYGDYGYTTDASLTVRRIGYNFVDSVDEDSGLFEYDFDDASTTGLPGGSLGNHLETIIGPGDSGGPALLPFGTGYALVGINTYTEGYGGLFGDTGGGIALNGYWGWISETTGLALIPEPSSCGFLVGVLSTMAVLLRRRRAGLPIPIERED